MPKAFGFCSSQGVEFNLTHFFVVPIQRDCDFCHFVGGYSLAMQTLGKDRDYIMIPDGFNEYTFGYYKDSSSRNCFSIILENEPDNGKALNVFFKILDAYLDMLGYEAVPDWKK